MARIAGIDLPRDKRVEIALTYIFGVGRSTSKKILENCQIDPNTKVSLEKVIDAIEVLQKEKMNL